MVEFDLTKESNLDYSTLRGFRWLFGVGAALVASFLVARETPIFLTNQPLDANTEFNLVFFPIVVAGLAYVFFAFGQGATSLQLTDERIELRYRNGGQKVYAWRKPGFSLTLWKYSTDSSTPRREYFMDVLVARIPLRNPISAEASDAILREAAKRGLEVTSKAQDWFGSPLRTRITIRSRGA